MAESRKLNNFRVNVRAALVERSSQSEVARVTGIGRPFLNRILTGKSDCSIGTAERIADALEIPLEILLAEPPKKTRRHSSTAA